MRRDITITRTRTFAGASCEQCGGGPREWTRERARQHADEKRHTVRYYIEDTTTYAPNGDTHAR